MKTKKVKQRVLFKGKKQLLRNKCDNSVSGSESRVFICSLGSFEQKTGQRVLPESGRCNATIRIQIGPR